MKYPEEFTTEELLIANTIMLIPKGDLVYPYVKYITRNFKFELRTNFDKKMLSNNHLLILQLYNNKKILNIEAISELSKIGYLRVYDAKEITRMLKIKSLFEK